MKQNLSQWLAGLCRWAARILGTLLVLVVVAIAVGEGMPNPFTQPVPVQLGFLGLALVMGGILAAWRWEVAPALLSLACWCLFVLAVMRPPRGPNVFVSLLALPAILLGTDLAAKRAQTNAN